MCIKYDILFRQAVARDKARLGSWTRWRRISGFGVPRAIHFGPPSPTSSLLVLHPLPDQALPVAPSPSWAGTSLTPQQVRRSAAASTMALAPVPTVHLPTSAGSQSVVETTLARPVPELLGSRGPLAELHVHTPLRHSEFERELSNRPNKAWVSWLLHSILHGISIGFNGPRTPYIARNLSTALQHPEVISSELAKEVATGRVLGPFTDRPLPNLRISGLGVALKENGK